MTVKKSEDGKFVLSKTNYTLLSTLYNLRSSSGQLCTKFVGWPGIHPDSEAEMDEIRELLKAYDCHPVFPPKEAFDGYMNFCHKVLWPLFHNVVQVDSLKSQIFDQTLWYNYQQVNKAFADTVAHFAQDKLDVVWVHDYPLLLIPQFLMRRLRFVNVGLFLHSCFPSSELFRMLPVREEILRGILCADLVGFQFFEYARHFLVAAKRIIGVDHRIRLGGLLQVEYSGRSVLIKVGHSFLDPVAIVNNWLTLREGALQAAMALRSVAGTGPRFIFGAIDRSDILSGLDRKFDAYASFLRSSAYARGKVILVQYVYFPTVAATSAEKYFLKIQAAADAINDEFRDWGPAIIFKPGPIRLEEKWGLYLAADAYIDTSLKQGLSLTPFEFLMVRNLHAPALKNVHENTANQACLPGTFFTLPSSPPFLFSPTDHSSLLASGELTPSLPARGAPDADMPPMIANLMRMQAFNQHLASLPLDHPTANSIFNNVLNNSLHIAPLLSGSQPFATIIISEFAGVSRVLASAKRVNPYDPRALVVALDEACHVSWPFPADPPPTAHTPVPLPPGAALAVSPLTFQSVSFPEEQILFSSDVSFVLNNSTHQWAEGFLIDLRRARKRRDVNFVQVGLGAGLRLLGIDQAFCQLDASHMLTRFKNSFKRRVFFLDYEGTITAPAATPVDGRVDTTNVSNSRVRSSVHAAANQMLMGASVHHEGNLPVAEEGLGDVLDPRGAPPSRLCRERLEKLCSDPRNWVTVLSGRKRVDLEKWLGDIDGLGLCAEHGYLYRLPRDNVWKTASLPTMDGVAAVINKNAQNAAKNLSKNIKKNVKPLNKESELKTTLDHQNDKVNDISESAANVGTWKGPCLDIMAQFVERTPGAFIENKGSALVFQYRAADEEFGLWQSKELHNYLSEFLFDQPVDVISGKGYLEVRLRGVTKGKAVERILLQLSQIWAREETQNLALTSNMMLNSTSNMDAGAPPANVFSYLTQQQQALLHPEFILCMGDDRSDEDMFVSLHTLEDQVMAETVVEMNDESDPSAANQGKQPSNMKHNRAVSSSLANILGASNKNTTHSQIESHIPTPSFAGAHPFSTHGGVTMSINNNQLQSPPDSCPVNDKVAIFSVTVGKKPSAAKYFVHDMNEVNDVLDILASHSTGPAPHSQTDESNSVAPRSTPNSPPKLYL